MDKARAGYLFMFLIFFVLSIFARDGIYHVLKAFNRIPHFKLFPDLDPVTVGKFAVLRISAVLASFFVVMAAITLPGSFGDAGGVWKWVHKKLWCPKYTVVIVAILGSFAIPDNLFLSYGTLARVLSGLFLVIQILFLVDFAYRLNESLVEKGEDAKIWLIINLVIAFLCYAGALIMVILCYAWFSPCSGGVAFPTITLILIVVMTGISLSVENGALLPAAAVSVYCSYLCFTALMIPGGGLGCSKVDVDPHSWGQLLVSSGLAIFVVGYACVSAASQTALSSGESSGYKRADSDADSDSDDDASPSSYSYYKFHIMMALGSMYMAMAVTGWTIQGDKGKDLTIDEGPLAMWVKIISEWLTALVYSWTLLAPILFPDRDFS